MITKILLTGVPGAGKTTVIRKVAEALGQKAAGFYTLEKRQGRQRVGFEIITLDGNRAMLSHENISSKYRVGRYGVDVDALDSVAVPSIEKAISAGLVTIIDEIGKMELFSRNFREAVMRAFDSAAPLVAVIMLKPNEFADRLKHRADVELIEVSPANRDALPALIAEKVISRE